MSEQHTRMPDKMSHQLDNKIAFPFLVPIIASYNVTRFYLNRAACTKEQVLKAHVHQLDGYLQALLLLLLALVLQGRLREQEWEQQWVG